MKTTLITDSKKLNSRIDTVTKTLKTGLDNVQPILVSAIWRTLAHTDDSSLQRLIEKLPAKYQSHAISYALAFAPVVKTGKDDIHPVKMRKGTSPDIAKADKVAATLPNWLEWAKSSEGEKPYDAAKAVSTFFSGLKKKIENGKIDENHLPMVNALLSFESNILAGINREKLIIDMLELNSTTTQAEKTA